MRRQHLLTLASALAGAALFAYAVRRAGIADIIDGIGRVGWGLVLILGLAGLRFLIRAECWRLCLPATVAFPLPRALESIKALARYRGSTIGCAYAEAFMLVREVQPG